MPIELSEDYLFGKKEFDKKLQAIAHLDKRNHELKIKNLRELERRIKIMDEQQAWFKGEQTKKKEEVQEMISALH